MITLQHILYAYNNVKDNKKRLDTYYFGKHIGYLEAGLLQFDYLETRKEGNRIVIATQVIKPEKWYRKEIRERDDEAILRMTEKLLNDNDLL
jgi:hypothetical protein